MVKNIKNKIIENVHNLTTEQWIDRIKLSMLPPDKKEEIMAFLTKKYESSAMAVDGDLTDIGWSK